MERFKTLHDSPNLQHTRKVPGWVKAFIFSACVVAMTTYGIAACVVWIVFRLQSVPIKVAEGNTRITHPLRPDGSIDYLAALNARSSRGVTPDNNAAVLIWQALGPESCTVEPDAYFEALGIPVPTEEGNYFVSIERFEPPEAMIAGIAIDLEMSATEDAETEAATPLTNAATSSGDALAIHERLSVAAGRPWSEQEFPLLVRWLRANETPLRRVVEASSRPKMYAPLVAPPGTGFACIDAVVPMQPHVQPLSEAILARAMLRVSANQIDEAWHDLIAVHRLSRLLMHDQTCEQRLEGMAINERVCSAERQLLIHSKIETEQLERMRSDLATLAPVPDISDSLDANERYQVLDAICTIASETLEDVPEGIQEMRALPVDWNVVLRRANQRWDELVAACRSPDRPTRNSALLHLDNELHEHVFDVEIAVGTLSPLFESRQSLSHKLADLLVQSLLPDLSWTMDSQEQMRMDLELTKLSFALAVYSAHHNRYPRQLEELVPRYTDKVPNDVFTGTPIHYRLVGHGCDLQSAGADGKLETPPESHLSNQVTDDWWNDDFLIMLP